MKTFEAWADGPDGTGVKVGSFRELAEAVGYLTKYHPDAHHYVIGTEISTRHTVEYVKAQ